MTEAEWLTCNDPKLMLEYLWDKGSYRKKRLFGAATFQRLAHLLTDSRHHRAIAMLEEMAEGAARQETRSRLLLDLWKDTPADAADDPYQVGKALYQELGNESAGYSASKVSRCLPDRSALQQEQSQLLRCIFGNPFRRLTVQAAWLAWSGGTVRTLAQAIYDERAFDRMPILADALEDAGCDDADILAHCRGDGPHVRGCWVVDLILGKQ
jgi:hypothetical protein